MDEYRFNSGQEPKDEYLHQLMQEAADDVRKSNNAMRNEFFQRINQQISLA